MRHRMVLAYALVGLVALGSFAAPAAMALSKPTYLFLRDTPLPDGSPAPPLPIGGIAVGDGELVVTPPRPLDIENPENNTAPQTRTIVPATEQIHPTQFVMLNQSLNTGHIFGPIVILLYVPESPTVQSGNLSVQLVELPPEYAATDIGPTGRVIANATIDLAYHNTTLPDPQAMVPPDPTNTTAALAHIQGQLLFYGFTQLAKSQYVMYLDDNVPDKIVNTIVDKDAKLALRFSLLPSTNPAPLPAPLPIAQGGGQPIVYNFALTPSLIYVPWYQDDAVTPPPVGPNPPPPPVGPNPPPPPPVDPSATSPSGTNKAGAPEMLFVLGVLGALAMVRRRK